MSARRWVRRPEGSTWGDFGPDDQLGRQNLVTAEKVKEGISEVKEGKVFCLSLPLNLPGGTGLNPNRQPPSLRPSERHGFPTMNFPASIEDPHFTDLICDDIVELNMQYSTQWDSLAHVGHMFDVDEDGVTEHVYYNGYRAGVDICGPYDFESGRAMPEGGARGALRLGIENLAASCVQGRGVMIDFVAHFGLERKLVGYDDLMGVLEKDAVEITEGDFVCFHTGIAQMLVDAAGDFDPAVLRNSCAAIDGRDEKIQNWITDTGLSALIADNLAVEYVPARDGSGDSCAKLPLHEHCLFRLGVNLGELWHLTELANWLRANNRYRFLLTAPPLRFPGAVGAPATPVATV